MSSRLNILKAEKLKIDIKNMGVNKKNVFGKRVFDQRYGKNSNIVKYYNLKELVFNVTFAE